MYSHNISTSQQVACIHFFCVIPTWAVHVQVTVDSLQKTIQQLKSEATRYKSRAHKAEQQVAKVMCVIKLSKKIKALYLCCCQAQEDKERSDSTSSSSVTIRDQPSVTDEVKNVQSADVVDRSEFNELNKKLLKLSEEKAVVEGKLECLKQASSPEEREKAEIIVAEKKARNQVCMFVLEFVLWLTLIVNILRLKSSSVNLKSTEKIMRNAKNTSERRLVVSRRL